MEAQRKWSRFPTRRQRLTSTSSINTAPTSLTDPSLWQTEDQSCSKHKTSRRSTRHIVFIHFALFYKTKSRPWIQWCVIERWDPHLPSELKTIMTFTGVQMTHGEGHALEISPVLNKHLPVFPSFLFFCLKGTCGLNWDRFSVWCVEQKKKSSHMGCLGQQAEGLHILSSNSSFSPSLCLFPDAE